jgi:ligand-binding sensor domain-containing protein
MFPVRRWPQSVSNARLIAGRLLLFAAALASVSSSAESDYIISSWSTEEGLPQNSVTAIAQTANGYLWLGTFNGLVRFDGTRFVVFDSNSTPELRSSRITALTADRRGRLWVLSEFGDLAVLDGGLFTDLRESVGKAESVLEDAAGQIWVQGATALERLDHGARIPLTEFDGTDFGRIREPVCDAQGAFWVVRKAGIGFLESGRFVFSRGLFGSSEPPTRILPSRDRGLWAAVKSSGLTKYRDGKCVLPARSFPMNAASPRALLEDSRGNVWIGTFTHGLMRYGTNGQWEVFNTRNGLSHESVRAVHEDPEGNIWVGTDGGGLQRLNLRTFRIHGAEHGVALTVTEDRQGEIWLGFHGKAIKRMQGEEIRPVTFPPLVEETGAYWSLYADRQGMVWASDQKGGLLRLHRQGVDHYRDPEIDLQSTRSLFQDRAGAIWAGHTGGLMRFDQGHYTRFTMDNGLPVKDVRALAEDAEGNLLIGSNGRGLARYKSGRFNVYTQTNGLADNRIWSLCSSTGGVVWIGTFGSGLSRFRREKFFNFDQALPVSVVTSILEDDFGYVWFGSLKGIFRAKRSDLNAFADGKTEMLIYQHYGKTDGLESIECSGGLQPAAWKSRDGKLWFATLKGVAMADPQHIPFNSYPPPVAIEETLVDDRLEQAAIESPGQDMRTWRVRPGSSRLEFRYTACSFKSPEKVRFKHRLKGLDPAWIEAGNRRTAPYMNVPPGRYQFQVVACNNDGIWNQTGARMAVIVLPLYWQTGWFKCAMVAAVIGLGWLAYHIRVVQLEGVIRLRLRIAGDLHDEIGANLGSIGLNTDLLRHEPGLTPQNREDLASIGEVASQTAQAVRDIVWFTNPDFDNTTGMIRRMRELATLMLAGRDWSFEIPDATFSQPLSLEFRRNVFFIFKEALHNIVKHSDAARCEIRLRFEPEALDLSIKDTGRGFSPGKSSSGHGLRGLRRRAEELGGTIQIVSSAGDGTQIRLHAPFRRARNYFGWFKLRLPRTRDL